MPLAPGSSFGVYRVLGRLGAGGMGEVFLARDTSLDRDVALKTLPEGFASDPERVALFQREARVLASLNHPNIGAIHGLETSSPTPVLVLELVEGETLAERLKRGRVPVPDALEVARRENRTAAKWLLPRPSQVLAGGDGVTSRPSRPEARSPSTPFSDAPFQGSQ